MKMRWMLLLLVSISGTSAFAQEKFFIFPQVADGRFPDGTYYRSQINVQQWLSTGNVNCTLRLNGMSTTFGSESGSLFTFSMPKDGWLAVQTAGTQSFQSGYAALTCSDYVYANLTYSFFTPTGLKLGEATVFGVNPYYTMRLLADQTSGARLGIAIANDTDIEHTYRLTLRHSNGSTFTTSSVTIAARRSLARFLDELVPSTVGGIFEVEVDAQDFTDLSVIGLRYSGQVFSTIPASR